MIVDRKHAEDWLAAAHAESPSELRRLGMLLLVEREATERVQARLQHALSSYERFATALKRALDGDESAAEGLLQPERGLVERVWALGSERERLQLLVELLDRRS